MFHRTDKKKSNNKGFSLVELIVVIAIMAVLVAVLAPQFTKYIDQSRKSNDAATVAGIVTAAQVGIADTTNGVQPATYTIKVTTTGTQITASNDVSTTELEKAISEACGELNKIKCTAKAWEKDGITIELIYAADGTVEVDYSKTQAFYKYINGEESANEKNVSDDNND